ncbi:MAG: hypothetical protein KKF62_04745 [Bacteroidetes bacterium]|nr:hypothetical protein [Bacteroidota bacterium]MBU1114828.1 hypothetical protein [Bacteroidota bacterium]MBU1799975.1 hypothetical protein [Bacteroidota bacterium]
MKKFLFAFLLLLNFNFFAQIRIKEIASNLPSESPNYSSTVLREIIPFNDNWNFTTLDSEKEGVKLNVPAIYNSNDVVVFQKDLNLSNADISHYNFKIYFLGISYSADIFLNDLVIYKKAGGNIPFEVELPSDLITLDGNNILKVVIKSELDSETSIPLYQRFLFPKYFGGIVRDVFLKKIPKENLELVRYSTDINRDFKSAQVNFELKTNYNFTKTENKYKIEVLINDNFGEVTSVKKDILNSELNSSLIELNITNPRIWDIKTPNQYIAEFRLFKNDSLIDLSKKSIIIAKLENRPDGFFLNYNKFEFKGVTYIHSDKEYGESISYSDLRNDLQIIKDMGLNSVRFAKATPHPFALEICSELGLVPFIEIPLNSPPKLIVLDANFSDRVKRYIDEFVKSYSNYSSIFIVGVGSGYLSNSPIDYELISTLCKNVHSNGNFITYASFDGIPKTKIDNLDLYGVEIFNNFLQIESNIANSTVGIDNIFISEATYPTYNGSTNGYLNSFSLEAQAKYFENTIDFANSKNISGFFLNSMFDYYGDFSSFYAKYSENNLYRIGILGVDKNLNSTSYKVIKAKINNSPRVTIPLGNSKDDAPMFFIIVGLVLSILMGILVNSKKKLREDASRAFIRPYNFFADIRDHRIISGFATVLLMLILSCAHSLLIINILYFLRDNILFEKVLLSFGIPSLISSLNYFAWNPIEAFFFFSLLSVFSFLFLSALISLTSFFIKIKIYFTSIFFTVIWASLPLALLLPVKMVLYRILEANIINHYIYIFLFGYLLWLISRVMKGVYVIFDINAGRVYLYAFVIFLILFGSLILYFQINHSTIYYLINVFNQAKLI